ncbi:MAG TPA: hypothetical protein VIF57_20265 [Polyangia bacterium]|jgi:hypothetical protein
MICSAAALGCGGSALTPDAGTGIVISTPPPFSIPPAPTAGNLQLCDVNASGAWPIGFLFDGRAIVGVPVSDAGAGATWVLAWDPRTNAVEPLFTAKISLPAPYAATPPFVVSADGRRIFEIAQMTSFRVHDVGGGARLSDEPIALDVTAVSGDGNVVLDVGLRVYSAAGQQQFDFSPLLPAGLHSAGLGLQALSFDGSAVAVGMIDADRTPSALVAYDDGRVVTLPDPGPYVDCDGAGCGFSWSTDGRHVLQFGRGGLRVWEVATAQLTARLDQSVAHAAFLADSDDIVTIDDQGNVAERAPSLTPTFTSGIVDRDAVFGAGGRQLGLDATGLAVVDHDGPEGRWPQFGSVDWLGAVAVRGTDSFQVISGGAETSAAGSLLFPVRLERFEHGKAGPTAVFHSHAGQSEWRGDVALAPDQTQIAAVFPDLIVVLDPATLTPLARIDAAAGVIAWSPDGRYLAATPDLHYRDGSRPAYVPASEITVWEAATGKLARRFAAPAYAARIAYEQGGARLVGWGYPTLDAVPPTGGGASQARFPVTFEIDLVTGQATTIDMPPFVAATRELVATPVDITSISTGQPLTTIHSQVIRAGAFSGDFSLLAALDDYDATQSSDLHLLSVADGSVVAGVATGYYGSALPALAASRDGRRVQLDSQIYCLVDQP